LGLQYLLGRGFLFANSGGTCFDCVRSRQARSHASERSQYAVIASSASPYCASACGAKAHKPQPVQLFPSVLRHAVLDFVQGKHKASHNHLTKHIFFSIMRAALYNMDVLVGYHGRSYEYEELWAIDKTT